MRCHGRAEIPPRRTGPRPAGYRMHTSRFALYPVRLPAGLRPALRPFSSPRPPFVTPDPDPGSMSSSRTRSGTLAPDAAAAGGEQAQPLKPPREPRLGPGSGAGATVMVGRQAALAGSGPLPRAIARAWVRGRGRAYRGGAARAPDCARETPDAPRPSVPAGVFFAAPSRRFLQKKPKGGPGSRLSLLSFYTIWAKVKPIREHKMKLLDIFHEMPVETRAGGATACRKPAGSRDSRPYRRSASRRSRADRPAAAGTMRWRQPRSGLGMR